MTRSMRLWYLIMANWFRQKSEQRLESRPDAPMPYLATGWDLGFVRFATVINSGLAVAV